jgi:hypothetical protein
VRLTSAGSIGPFRPQSIRIDALRAVLRAWRARRDLLPAARGGLAAGAEGVEWFVVAAHPVVGLRRTGTTYYLANLVF